ncbi:MAG: metallophosphoesterase [Gammaproteobacteria bacterium]|nr:metallophosphoesterase [Gammaproteobacteria bacterium]
MSTAKIRIFSDLHLEFCDWTPPPAEADFVVLAGDIHCGTRGLKWARRQFPDTPVIYVPGNHEFHGGSLPEVLTALRKEAQRSGVQLLDGDEFIHGGIRFLGATLWTDYALYGSAPMELSRAMADASNAMYDFLAIRATGEEPFRPELARDIHRRQVKWLTTKLSEPFDGPTVVITHHLPHRQSIHPKYERDPLNPSFVSDLDHLVRAPVAVWMHGHTHESRDYVVNGTRVVCNPRGYLPMEPNLSFDSAKIVELTPGH